MDHVSPAMFGAFSVVLVVAAINDFRVQKIPNILTFPTMLVALLWHGLMTGWGGLWFSFLGLVVGMGLMIIPYSMGWMGAGDAKLMGAAGAVLGAKPVIVALVLTCALGFFYAMILFVIHFRWSRQYFARYLTMVKLLVLTRQGARLEPDEKEKQYTKPKLWYGLPIAVAVLWTMAALLWGKLQYPTCQSWTSSKYVEWLTFGLLT